MAERGENVMDEGERAEWHSHVLEWARELAEEAGGYAADCSHNGGATLKLEDALWAIARAAEDLEREMRKGAGR